MTEPIMCPFCGGGDLVEQEQGELETEDEYWVIYSWHCSDCGEAFEKIVTQPLSEAFEDIEDDDTLWS